MSPTTGSNLTKDMKMNNENLSGDGLGKRRRRRSKRRLGASGVTLVGRKRRGKRKGRKICIRTAAGNKACGVRWRRRRRK